MALFPIYSPPNRAKKLREKEKLGKIEALCCAIIVFAQKNRGKI
jgi:hypothetical protein